MRTRAQALRERSGEVHAARVIGGGSRKKTTRATMSFFKVMIGDFQECLRLPPLFARGHSSLVNRIVGLQDSDGGTCRVKIAMVNGHAAFREGWKDFVTAHGISIGEFLIFEFTDRFLFSVKVYGLSACERKNFGSSRDGAAAESKRKRARRTAAISPGLVECKQETSFSGDADEYVPNHKLQDGIASEFLVFSSKNDEKDDAGIVEMRKGFPKASSDAEAAAACNETGELGTHAAATSCDEYRECKLQTGEAELLCPPCCDQEHPMASEGLVHTDETVQPDDNDGEIGVRTPEVFCKSCAKIDAAASSEVEECKLQTGELQPHCPPRGDQVNSVAYRYRADLYRYRADLIKKPFSSSEGALSSGSWDCRDVMVKPNKVLRKGISWPEVSYEKKRKQIDFRSLPRGFLRKYQILENTTRAQGVGTKILEDGKSGIADLNGDQERLTTLRRFEEWKDDKDGDVPETETSQTTAGSEMGNKVCINPSESDHAPRVKGGRKTSRQ